MHATVVTLTSRIGLTVMRELALHGPRTTSELMKVLGFQIRHTLLRTLNRLEVAGVVTVDLPPEERKGRQGRYSLDVDQARAYFAQIEAFVLGAELPDSAEPPASAE
jgi:DNA-binding HxlR family transcriptional regulator